MATKFPVDFRSPELSRPSPVEDIPSEASRVTLWPARSHHKVVGADEAVVCGRVKTGGMRVDNLFEFGTPQKTLVDLPSVPPAGTESSNDFFKCTMSFAG
jgi:hypothetical protein